MGMGVEFERKVFRHGGTTAVTIPKEIRLLMGIQVNDILCFGCDGDTIVIRKK